MKNQDFSRRCIDCRDRSRFTPHDGAECCWDKKPLIRQYIHALAAGTSECHISRPEKDALCWDTFVSRRQKKPCISMVPGSRLVLRVRRRNALPSAHRARGLPARCVRARTDWPDTPPLPEYSVPRPVAHFKEAERVLQVETPEEGLSVTVDERCAGSGARLSQPYRLVHPTVKHFLHSQADDGSLDGERWSVVLVVRHGLWNDVAWEAIT